MPASVAPSSSAPASATKGLASTTAGPALDAAVARRELLAFPAQHLPGLPLGIRISVQPSGFAHSIWLVSRHRDAPTGSLAFDADEVRALAIAAQAERVWPADFKGYCLLKLHEPSFRVTETLALGGAQRSGEPAWSLGCVLRWLDLELLDVELLTSPNDGAHDRGQEHTSHGASSDPRQGAAAAAA